MRRTSLAIFVFLCAVAMFPAAAFARVVRVEVLSRSDVAAGAPFGAGGPYERIVGRVYYAFDPGNEYDRQIVDLSLAPRNARGEVEAWSDVVILRPKDPARSAAIALVDIVNRGAPTTGVFLLNARPGESQDSLGYYGDALLMRQGLTIVEIGWEWDVPAGGGRLHFVAPPVGDSAKPVYGIVRSDITIDSATTTIPLGHRTGARTALGYPVADPRDPEDVLTVRDDPVGPRTTIPRGEWRFAREENGAVVDDSISVYMARGFIPGKIYEVVYRAKHPVVVGTGLAAVRDIISYLKNDPTSIARVRFGIASGVSQTGRFIRQFLYDGFNIDEAGRAAFDGFFAYGAGAGRGSFNHRFAQPSRDAQPYSTFFYPTDLFPFTSVEETDPLTKETGGLRSTVGRIRYETALPKVFYVDDGYEYWGRAASLTQTTVDGVSDIGFLPSERRYVIASAQHSSPSAFPPTATMRIGSSAAFRGDPLDQRLVLRALLVDLVDWVKAGKEPPPSVYPTITGKTLVHPDAVRFPTIPGVTMARIPAQPYRLDFGPRWAKERIITREPPVVGRPYTVLVAQVDSIGNDLGGIRSVELQVPLATYFPWELRTGLPAAQDRLVSFSGTVVPLPRTEAERAQSHDSRPSLQKLYVSHLQFSDLVDAAIKRLVAQRVMLAEDVAVAKARMEATWSLVTRSR